MNLYSFAAAGLITSADRRRRPFVSKGQVARTLLLVLSFALAIAVTSRSSHADDGASAGVLPDPMVIAKTREQAAIVEPRASGSIYAIY